MANSSFIAKLLRQQDINIEFNAKYDLKTILKSVCAFLNADGGWILIGYSNKKNLGVSGDIKKIVEEIETSAINNIEPQPFIYIDNEVLKGKDLIFVNVLKGSRQPYSYNGEYYIKKGGSTVKANTDEISILLRINKTHLSTWEKISVTDASLNDLDKSEIENTIKDAKVKYRDANLPKTADEFLSYFKMLDYSLISNGAMLLYGKEPIRFIPQCRIRITVMPYGKSGSSFSDELFIEDNLFISYQKTIDYFAKILPLNSEFNQATGHRETSSKYPKLALREAIINAIVHRDYSDFSGDVTINIYPDKVEIINSGEIPSNIISKDNKIIPHHSVLRNPTIAQIFYLRGRMEKIGRGLNLIKDQFIEEGYKSPIWKSENGYTTLTLYTVSEQLNSRMVSYLIQKEVGSVFTSKEYESYFLDKISEKTARNDIAKLVKSKYIIKEGQGPSTKYKRSNKKLPEIAG